MNTMHDDFLLFFSITLGLLLGAGLLHLLPRMGQAGKRLSEAACRAPLLDVVVCYFTVLPLIIGPLVAGLGGPAHRRHRAAGNVAYLADYSRGGPSRCGKGTADH
jgi:hypothetical protein